MSYNTIEYSVDGPLAILTLDRPAKLNAINAEMVVELNQALDDAEADEDVRVVVLNGAGKAFSSGFDIEPGDGAKAAIAWSNARSGGK